MKRWIILLIIAAGIGFLGYYRSRPLGPKILIRGTVITVDVAVTEAQKERGLSGRLSMPADQGMLFPYDHKETYNFWMREMLFPLDFVWIDGKTVADITENVPPPQSGERPVIVMPKTPVDRVLELNAGAVKRLGITIGDQATFLDR